MNAQVKTSELSGRELNYWVDHVIGYHAGSWLSMEAIAQHTTQLSYDQRWEAVGYLMATLKIGLAPPSTSQPLWTAYESESGATQRSDNPKLAVLRCLVASRLGNVFTDDNPDRRVSIETLRNQNLDPLPARRRTPMPGSTAASTPDNLPALPDNLPDSWI